MAIARTPTVSTPKTSVVDEKKIESLISKGGSTTLLKEKEIIEDEDPVKTVLVRTYESQVQEMDQLLARIPKRKRPSRNTFIVEAIEEKLQREKAKRK